MKSFVLETVVQLGVSGYLSNDFRGLSNSPVVVKQFSPGRTIGILITAIQLESHSQHGPLLKPCHGQGIGYQGCCYDWFD